MLIHQESMNKTGKGKGGGTGVDETGNLDENFLRWVWQQMLQVVHIIHEERIIHADLKPANFLFVEVSSIINECVLFT